MKDIRKENPEFVEAVAGLSVEELDARLAQLSKDDNAVDQAKEADEDLVDARDKASLLAAPYREAKAMNKLKAKFIISLITEKGGK